ncbi:MAG: proton-conducting transporter membrane subunit [Victivallales bacterium]
MTFLLAGLFILLLSGFVAFFTGKSGRAAAFSAILGTLSCLVLSSGICLDSLINGRSFEFSFPLTLPFANFAIGIDPLSAFFLLPLLLLSSLCAIYGSEYMKSPSGGHDSRMSWFFFCLLVTGMTIVVIARNGVLFLIAWEIMALSSFFLVTYEHEKREVRKAGWIYLVASHVGVAFIFTVFAILGGDQGSLDFAGFQAVKSGTLTASLVFIFAVMGFGSKAGFIPLHIWLPEAHPVAPSHVSSLMSGIMIKLGIYGILRILTFLGAPPLWWGITFIVIGMSSGILGIAFALASHNIKRLLAYSSVENIGIISLGTGIGLAGISCDEPFIAILGFAGALLHVLNHCIFKGLLFLGAGTVLHETGTGDMDRLGGLMKKMPFTGACFMTGSASISGLPPFNGFVGEFLIFLAAFYGITSASLPLSLCSIVVIASLALIGGLAMACFSKAFGIVFLGEPRSDKTSHTADPGIPMLLPMIILSMLCLAVGFSGPTISAWLAGTVSQISGIEIPACRTGLKIASLPLLSITVLSSLLIIMGSFLYSLRKALPRIEMETKEPTWDCGYAKSVPRIQYTSSSFTSPVTGLFSTFLKTRFKRPATSETFPGNNSFSSETPDFWQEYIFTPIVGLFKKFSTFLIRSESGRIHVFILYIIITILTLLTWNFFR